MGEVTPGDGPPFWERPLAALNREQWEALCDGCGKCCLHKAEDEDTGDIWPTNIACRLLDTGTARCSDYRNRKAMVPDCLRLTPEKIRTINWLPDSCAYMLRHRGQPLPSWHYLISGSRETVHQTGHSVARKVVAEVHAGPIEEHLVEPSDPLWNGEP